MILHFESYEEFAQYGSIKSAIRKSPYFDDSVKKLISGGGYAVVGWHTGNRASLHSRHKVGSNIDGFVQHQISNLGMNFVYVKDSNTEVCDVVREACWVLSGNHLIGCEFTTGNWEVDGFIKSVDIPFKNVMSVRGDKGYSRDINNIQFLSECGDTLGYFEYMKVYYPHLDFVTENHRKRFSEVKK